MTVGTSDKYREITTEQIEACQNDLSEEHFAILMASTAGDYRSIAALFDMKIGTVKSRLNRARAKLAKVVKARKVAAP